MVKPRKTSECVYALYCVSGGGGGYNTTLVVLTLVLPPVVWPRYVTTPVAPHVAAYCAQCKLKRAWWL